MSTADVGILNQMQTLNALENIYYQDPLQAYEISRQAKASIKIRRKSQAEVFEYVSADSENRRLIQLAHPLLGVSSRTTFSQIRRAKRRIALGERINQARDPETVRLIERLSGIPEPRHSGVPAKSFLCPEMVD